LLPTTLINRFEGSCGTFRGGGGKNLMSLTTLGQFDKKKKKKKKNKKKKKKNFKIFFSKTTMTMGWMLA
jgi:hypothetical protein